MSDNKPTINTFINEMKVCSILDQDIDLSLFIMEMEVSVKAGGHYMSSERFMEITDYVYGLATQDNNAVICQQLEQANNLIERLETLLDSLGHH